MIGVIARLPVKEGKMDQALEAVKEVMKDVAGEEGTLLYTVNKDSSEPNTLVIMERYKDKASLDAHSGSPHFKAFAKKLPDVLAGKPEIKVLEEIHSI